MISFRVLGRPSPKGNARAFVNKANGKAIISSFGSGAGEQRLRGWDACVREAAARACGNTSDPVFVDKPISVEITFYMARPMGHWGKGKRAGQLDKKAPPAPRSKPDIDKLARSTLDALHGSVFDDDGRIVDLVARKRYAMPGREGAEIVVREWKDDRDPWQ